MGADRRAAPGIEGGEHGALRGDGHPGAFVVELGEGREDVRVDVVARLHRRAPMPRSGRPLARPSSSARSPPRSPPSRGDSRGREDHGIQFSLAHPGETRVDVAADVADVEARDVPQGLSDTTRGTGADPRPRGKGPQGDTLARHDDVARIFTRGRRSDHQPSGCCVGRSLSECTRKSQRSAARASPARSRRLRARPAATARRG